MAFSRGKKIILEVKDKTELVNLYEKATQSGLTAYMVKDRGLTVVEPGTITCVGIGPDSSGKIDEVTGHLDTL